GTISLAPSFSRRSRMSHKTKPVPFWQSIPLEALAEEQGARPVTDLDELSDLWPADDDPDALLNYILTERRERRNRQPPSQSAPARVAGAESSKPRSVHCRG